MSGQKIIDGLQDVLDGNVVEPRKSIIPAWCAEQAAHIVKNYGSDPAFLEGAIAAALHSERERAANAAYERGKELREPAIGSDIASTIREPSAAPAMPA